MINQWVGINLRSERNHPIYTDFKICFIFQLNSLNETGPMARRSRKLPIQNHLFPVQIVEYSVRFCLSPLINTHLSELAWLHLCSFQPTLFMKESQFKKKIFGKWTFLVPSKILCIPQAKLKWNTVSEAAFWNQNFNNLILIFLKMIKVIRQ